MRAYFTGKGWTIWMACFAILLNALAPTISHAMAAHDAGRAPATWEICRAPGSTVRTDGSHQLLTVGKFNQQLTAALMRKHADHESMAMADCAYCLPHAGSFALLPASFDLAAISAGRALRPYLFYHAPRPLLALSAAPPRGPPSAT